MALSKERPLAKKGAFPLLYISSSSDYGATFGPLTFLNSAVLTLASRSLPVANRTLASLIVAEFTSSSFSTPSLLRVVKKQPKSPRWMVSPAGIRAAISSVRARAQSNCLLQIITFGRTEQDLQGNRTGLVQKRNRTFQAEGQHLYEHGRNLWGKNYSHIALRQRFNRSSFAHLAFFR